MLEALRIESFRGIRDLELNDLQAVNLLIGDNDVGKTTVLEAIKIFERPDDLPSILRASRMRILNRMPIMREYYSPFETFLHLFPFTDGEMRLAISAKFEGRWFPLQIIGEMRRTLTNGKMHRSSRKDLHESETEQEIDAFWGELSFSGRSQPIEIREDSSFVTTKDVKSYPNIEYVAPGLHLNGLNRSVFRSKSWEDATISALRIINPDIDGIRLVPSEYGSGSNPVIVSRTHGYVPIYACGDGLKKIFALASVLPAARNGILMIDEVETSLQAKHLATVFDWLLSACRDFNIQLFVTTHSGEAISAMSRCAFEHPSELACYRLERFNGTIRARRYSERKLESLVNGSGFDVR